MDKGSLTIGVILIIICIIPFVVMRLKSNKRNQALVNCLNAKAKEVGAIITHHEICGSFIIGIDEANNFIFFHQEDENNMSDLHVNLKEVEECKVINTYIGSSGSRQLIDRLELGFVPKSKGSKVPKFELFSSNSSSDLGTELITANEWAARINKRLTA